MCRNIRILHNFEPPSTPEEIRAAAIQYVRKVSGVNRPSQVALTAYERAVDDVAAVTERLLGALPRRVPHRTREEELERARLRWSRRVSARTR